MPVPNIDTFEHDIAEEIKTREASLTDIASAGGDLGNTEEPRTKATNLILLFGIVFIILIVGGGVGWYLLSPKEEAQVIVPVPMENNTQADLFALSTYIHDGVGGMIQGVQKSEYGYTLSLREYTPVFAYMIKNERAYADDLGRAVGSLGTATANEIPFVFTDVTISNQNMRVGTSGSSTVVYAFINTKSLVISSSTEGILTLRNAILAQ